MDKEPQIDQPSVVVGYDGSDHALVALRWAAHEAARRGVGLSVLHAVNINGLLPDPGGAQGWLPKIPTEALHAVAEEGADQARRVEPAISVQAEVETDGPAHALVTRSEGAGLLVLGSPTHGLMLGSVAHSVTTHAHCPVAVIGGDRPEPPDPGRPILVGVDGSIQSADALDLACRYAEDIGAPLQLLSAWDVSAQEAWASRYWSASVYRDWKTTVQSEALAVLEAAAGRVAKKHPGLAVSTTAIEGGTVPVLVEAGKQASMMVLGSRGSGGFRRLLLGSVTRGVMHHLPCPLLVVRHLAPFQE